MIAVLALALAATPVSLQLDLSRQTRERAGARLEESIRQRLNEEGFELRSPAKIILRVDELHGVFRLSAELPQREPLTRELAPTGQEWRDELALELAQRLVSLAHEAELLLPPVTARTAPPNDGAVEQAWTDPGAPDAGAVIDDPGAPDAGAVTDDPFAAADLPAPAAAPADASRIGAGVRAGVALRFPAVDPSLAFHGVLTLGTVEPELLMGLTIAPGPSLLAFEVPLAVGLRLRFAPRDAVFEVVPEALVGGRAHFYGPSPLDPGGARLDFIAMLGATAQVKLGGLRVGLRAGLEVSAPRTHLLGAETLWERGPFTLLFQLVIERS